jgi:hypothetical protein
MKCMDKIFALTFILVLQPAFAYLTYFAIGKALALINVNNRIVVLAVSSVWYIVFAFLFARGFLSSDEAKRLGFK